MGQFDTGRNGMRGVTGFLILVGASALVASTLASADTPASQTSASASSAASQSSSASQSSASATASASAPKKTPIPSGYRRVVTNGEEKFCRTDPVPGSRAERVEVCRTAEQLKADAERSQDYLQRVQSTGGINDRACMPGAGAC